MPTRRAEILIVERLEGLEGDGLLLEDGLVMMLWRGARWLISSQRPRLPPRPSEGAFWMLRRRSAIRRRNGEHRSLRSSSSRQPRIAMTAWSDLDGDNHDTGF